jgi:hypothetical protein
LQVDYFWAKNQAVKNKQSVRYMNKKRIRDCMALAWGAISLGITQGASAVPLTLSLTGTLNGGLGVSTVYDGTSSQVIADGTPFNLNFNFDTAAFPASVVGGDNLTYYHIAAGPGCTGANVGQDPLLPNLITASATLGGSAVQGQSFGNLRNCDYISMLDSGPNSPDNLVVAQDAYNQERIYYTDGDLTIVSPTETPYHMTETRISGVSISGWLVEDSFSPAVLLTELAGNLTVDSTYGMQMLATFERNFYSCSDRGGTGYVCTNEPYQAGDLYYLIGSASSIQGTVVPGPAPFGLLATALAGLGFVRSRWR